MNESDIDSIKSDGSDGTDMISEKSDGIYINNLLFSSFKMNLIFLIVSAVI